MAERLTEKQLRQKRSGWRAKDYAPEYDADCFCAHCGMRFAESKYRAAHESQCRYGPRTLPRYRSPSLANATCDQHGLLLEDCPQCVEYA